VKFVLWSAVNKVAILIIPEEAEIILPLLLDASGSPVHLLVYQAPITRHMLHFDDFKFLAFPTLPANWKAPVWLKIELGIYSGRLYFRYSEYEDLCNFLGVRHKIGPSGADEITNLDGIDEDDDVDEYEEDVTESTSQRNVFTRKPLTFLQEWLAVRRKGQSFEQTPMGFVCQGRYLHPSHHFFASTVIEPQLDIPLTTAPAVVENGHLDTVEDIQDEEDQGGDILRPEDYVEDYVVD
jgi:hypothetical protein